MASRAMLLRLADRLAIPLLERNALLVAAGFAPAFAERPMDAPDLAPAMAAVAHIVDAHAPHPAIAVDRHWQLLRANAPAGALLAGASSALLTPPMNVLRLSLYPDGLAPRIVNYRAWRAHVLERLQRQIEASGDAALAILRAELAAYPVPANAKPWRATPAPTAMVATPLQLETPGGVLSFLSTTTVFGTAFDLTLAGVVIESFFPADEATAASLRASSGNRAGA